MNILKKSFLFAMPALMTTACDDVRNYVITDKDDAAKEIFFHAVGDKNEEHLMVFDFVGAPADTTLFQYLQPGDTISMYYTGNPIITPQYGVYERVLRGDTLRRQYPLIVRVNGKLSAIWARDKAAADRFARDKEILQQKQREIRSRKK